MESCSRIDVKHGPTYPRLTFRQKQVTIKLSGGNMSRGLKVKYEDVAAGQTAQALGATGAAGDMLHRLIIVPAATNAGTVALLDGTVSRNVFVTGTLADLKPITIEVGAHSVNGAWKVTTGASVSVIAVGDFS